MRDSDTATPILVCGLLSADVVFNVDCIPTRAIKYRADDVSVRSGGGGAYASIAVNRLGGHASLLARLGNDHFAQLIISSLVEEGIDCTHVSSNAHMQTPISCIAIDAHGDRQIVNYRDDAGEILSNDLLFNPLPKAVLVDTRWLAGSLYALDYARSHDVPGVVDAEAPIAVKALHLASHIAFSRQGLSDYASTDSIPEGLKKAQEQFSAWVCVTDGEHGTHLLQEGGVLTIPAPSIQAIDSLGAGDVWHGAFCVQLARGENEINAVRFANYAAALKCTQSGGGWSAPVLSDVHKFLETD
ncbi:MAG: hypothetical protein KTR32_11280 [Granulosicoccus sp.]|nr:hypothetical protein [Granulosicoccus sp.]